MTMVWKQKLRSCLLVGALLAGLMVIALPAQVYADAAVEDFWNTAYSVDYDVTVSAPDGGVNLRYGAGTEYEKILEGMIPNGTVLHIRQVAKANNGKEWGYTQYAGYDGWVILSQTKKVSASKPASSSSGAAASAPVSVNYNVEVKAPDGGVNIRSGPGAAYDKLQSNLIPNGTVLHISETAKADNGKEWGYTTYNGLKGWVFLGQTKVTSAAVTPADQAAPAQTEPAEEPAVQQPEQPETDPVADDVSQEGSSANEEEAAPTSTNSNIFTIAIIALVILAIIVAVVLLLARRRR